MGKKQFSILIASAAGDGLFERLTLPQLIVILADVNMQMLATPDNYIVITSPIGLMVVKDHGDSAEQTGINLFGRRWIMYKHCSLYLQILRVNPIFQICRDMCLILRISHCLGYQNYQDEIDQYGFSGIVT